MARGVHVARRDHGPPARKHIYSARGKMEDHQAPDIWSSAVRAAPRGSVNAPQMSR
jgi:hypothetical protein